MISSDEEVNTNR